MTSEKRTEPGASTPERSETPEGSETGAHPESAETPELRERAASSIRELLRQRNGKTICPSETARVIGGDGWRDLMPMVRDVAVGLVDEGQVIVQQKGEEVDITTARGPIRLAPGPRLT